jgi:serine/threonine protein kinase
MGDDPIEYGGWERLTKLGSGGQGTVYLARRPERVARLSKCEQEVPGALKKLVTTQPKEQTTLALKEFLSAIMDWIGPDDPRDLGALKVFRMPEDAEEAKRAAGRLRAEVEALEAMRAEPGVLRLILANAEMHWMISEYHRNGALSRWSGRYRGDPLAAMEALRPLAKAVAVIHEKGMVHRDIKPDNIYVAHDGALVLGDFGIVFLERGTTRVTDTFEKVGTTDWMPGWAFGMRPEDVKPTFDVFALGKVLWSMVNGGRKMRLWYFQEDDHNLEKIFPANPGMATLNSLLRRCVVQREADCLPNAGVLVGELDERLAILRRGGQALGDGIERPCRVCGKGIYSPLLQDPTRDRILAVPTKLGLTGVSSLAELYEPPDQSFTVRLFACGACGHVEMFRFPDGLALPAWSSH